MAVTKNKFCLCALTTLFVGFFLVMAADSSFAQTPHIEAATGDAAQEAAADPKLKLLEINESIIKIEEKINELNDRKLILEGNLNEISREATDALLNLSNRELGVANNYFNIFMSIGVVAGLLAGGSGLLMRTIVLKELTSTLDKRLNEKLDEKSNFNRKLDKANTFASLGYTWWLHYEPEYQKYFRGEKVDNLCVQNARLCKTLAVRGLSVLREINVSPENDNVFSLRVTLENQYIYSATACIVMSGLNGEAVEDVDPGEVLSRAHNCNSIIRDSRMKDRWFNLTETCAFCFIKLGDPNVKEIGVRMLEGLFKGEIPSKGFERPPREVLLDLYDDYYPPRGGGCRGRKARRRSQ